MGTLWNYFKGGAIASGSFVKYIIALTFDDYMMIYPPAADPGRPGFRDFMETE
jgi:hypothetical protein